MKTKYFGLKKTAGKGRSQIGNLMIQRYASFLAQNGGLQVSENKQCLVRFYLTKQLTN